jgi:hypothetical protein
MAGHAAALGEETRTRPLQQGDAFIDGLFHVESGRL